ncbi:hypothetical protein [Paenibacillus sp. NPDC058071]|uniref:hypothetical protein n=1 Tax=Paenibacillus sp. NPDC058071 TaxID=3346326 RepID=UPI0036DA0084
MIGILLAVVGCYALAALLVHLAHRWSTRRERRGSRHYVLVAHNQHMKMEWLARSFFAFGKRAGTEVKLTVVDGESTGQSAQIIAMLERKGTPITLHAGENEAAEKINNRKRLQSDEESSSLMWRLRSEGIITSSDQAVLVDLKNPSDLSKMPF